MVWSGRVTITGHTGGRHGAGEVLEGDVWVPKRSTWEVRGDNGHPDAKVEVEIRDGRPEVVEIWIAAKPRGRGIQSSDMQTFQLDNLIANIQTEVGRKLRPNPDSPGQLMSTGPNTENEAWAVDGAVRNARGRSRAPVSEEELRAVADTYREFASAAPITAIATRFRYSNRTAARRVQQARAAGLLPQTSPGKITT